MSQIDWSKAPKGFDFHFKPKRKDDAGGFYKTTDTGRFIGEHGSYISYADMHDLTDLFIITVNPQTPEWRGPEDGLPPVGTECIITPYNTIWGFSAVGDYQCNILAYHNDFVWVDIVDTPGVPVATRVDKVEFKLICTPEQIAAEERESVIVEMCELFMRNKVDAIRVVDCCERLYDAGCRMPGKGAKA